MTESPVFEAQVQQRPGTTFIDLSGRIDAASEEGLNEAYKEAESNNPSTIVLNFSEVTYINSTGIALIVGLLAKARQAKRKLAVYGLSEHYLEIFRITRLSDFMEVYTDET